MINALAMPIKMERVRAAASFFVLKQTDEM
jgi:hypothetical protein